jgi:hypothetical protein
MIMSANDEKEYVVIHNRKDCIGVWLRLLFKVLLTRKCIQIIYFFYFLKIIFDISALK